MKLSSSAVLMSAVLLLSFAGPANAVTDRQKRDCRTEYNKYCSAYDVESQGLRACMRKVRFQLSDRCIDALVAGGEVTPNMGAKLKAAR
ncbi:hypothetical protein V6C03_02980 [Methyloligella sp. 2.7D]|uniref:hypothetical protein n=1 Tax=unclassified Methyloligella TaxID=2625955 RepID=UPI00157BF548|nr:hypothetical protein [Methyloligella sp. GL2]QKP76413.1 hypothetical protein HT051_02440 [Methyloligella sp. GL2]